MKLKSNKLIFIYFSFFIIFAVSIPLLLNQKPSFIAILLAPLLLFLLLDNIDNYLKPVLMFSMFVFFYIDVPYRIQLINLVSYVLIIYFFLNYYKGVFNRIPLPRWVKISSGLLIFAVLLSSINSPFVSIRSLYYGLMFFIYILTGYIIYRTIFSADDIDKYIKFLTVAVSIYSIIIIINVFLSGFTRARGITGNAFSDVIVCSLLTVFFKYLFLDKQHLIHIFMAIVIFVALIFDQSRFAWLGFLLSFTYGLMIMIKFQKSHFIKRKISFLVIVIIIGISLIFITGLHQVILLRFSDFSFSVLQSNEEGELISNSLDMRILIWITAFNTFLNNPWTGVGYFMFHIVSENYNILPEYFYIEIVKGVEAHTTLMNFLCETGIIGLSSVLFFFIIIFFLSYRSIKLSKSTAELTRSIVLNILVFFIETTSIYSGGYTFGYNGYFLYFIFALVVANYVLLTRKYKLLLKETLPNLA